MFGGSIEHAPSIDEHWHLQDKFPWPSHIQEYIYKARNAVQNNQDIQTPPDVNDGVDNTEEQNTQKAKDKPKGGAVILTLREKAHYSCVCCGRSYLNIDALETHLKTYSKDKPYSCTQCGNSFVSYHEL